MSEAVKEVPKKERREFRNIHITELPNYRLPPAGWVSILHRVSGAGLFLALPFLLYLFQQSVQSEMTYAYIRGVMENPLVKLVLLGLIWAYMQHFCAGFRHLFMDMHWALEKESSRNSAIAVLVVSLLLTALAGLKLFGVF
ncbi:succinate dehydrogenase, cytochrome b556 subunit [Massilia sp. PAMC28688]|uniref:succinate dehydrogenase, cytochrome b556 subunit n=1 Tax=Massilia sp. PAMC28688 TaxID=2861283 RepID=UPI001C633B6B|nr:succinate dehydrogenase, cytochrome b556 subunit [Massilia sp. PAMC28688]QYF92260.1 succinate dehydrogenase, cytochrome b556 subunit [Massilia sp. PAMC28688]